MKTKIALLFLFIVGILFTSCQYEKRLYRNGYYVSHTSRKICEGDRSDRLLHTVKNPVSLIVDDSVENIEFSDQNTTTTNSQTKAGISNHIEPMVQNNWRPETVATAEGCETVVMKNGEEIAADVLEIGTEQIKYKKCGEADGPTIVVKNSDVFMIKYPNGTKTVIGSTSNEDPILSELSSEGGKSQLVAVLLCFFFGIIGVHRFYLGYIGIGIIQLLTLGGCGIWALIDLIMIITGDLKPKNGDYGKKF